MYQAAVFIHILSVIAWLGSAMFIVIAFVPALRADATRDAAQLVLRSAAGRIKIMGWTALILILLTGGYLMTRYITIPGFWQTPSGHVLGAKMLGFTIIAILSLLHDFHFGPRASRGAVEAPDAPATLKARKFAKIIGMVNLLIGLGVVFCGVTLVRPMWSAVPSDAPAPALASPAEPAPDTPSDTPEP